MLVIKQLLARLLTLPFDRGCPRHVFGTRPSEAKASALSAKLALGFMTFSSVEPRPVEQRGHGCWPVS
jgi:hypothetical protein